jgi:acetyl esterase/lipase
VFIHGDCWLNPLDMAHTFPAATALAQAGYAVWSLEYSRTGDPGGGWPGSYNDIKAGIQWIGNLSEYGINGENMVIVGHSAGGHLALLAGIDFPNSNAVVCLAAITDIVEYAAATNDCETATPIFMGSTFAPAKERYQKANPAGLNLHSKTLLLHGSVDSIVNVSQSFYQMPPHQG